MLGAVFDLVLFIVLLASFRIIWQLPLWSGMLVAAALWAAVSLTRRDFRRMDISKQPQEEKDIKK
jgi:hypothetical protein